MTRSKRPYIPKTKGCYECSQRRVHCDNSLPTCLKCTTRGLRCSGYGVRYRFERDVRASGNTVPTRGVRWIQEPQTGHSGSQWNGEQVSLRVQCPGENNDDDDIDKDGSSSTSNESQVAEPTVTDASRDEACGDDVEDVIDVSPPSSADSRTWISTDLALSPQKPWKQYFLNYFSERIAAEMVLVDDHRNAWRHLVLPIAQQDELVEATVLSAAAFHFATNVDDRFLKPNAMYQRAIRNLRSRQDLMSYDMVANQSVLLSILVLLVAAVVSGSSDFRTIFGLLEACVHALGGEDCISHGELGTFIVWQIHKYRGYVAPLLGPERGIQRLNQSITKPYTCEGWEDISLNAQFYPHFESSWSLIYNLNEQACNMYVLRALSDPNAPPRTDLVDTFIKTLETLAADSPGMYMVPWTIFLAAAESSEPEQQRYFEEVLLRHHKRNGFANLPLALRFLRQSWQNPRSRNWTAALAELPVFVV